MEGDTECKQFFLDKWKSEEFGIVKEIQSQ